MRRPLARAAGFGLGACVALLLLMGLTPNARFGGFTPAGVSMVTAATAAAQADLLDVATRSQAGTQQRMGHPRYFLAPGNSTLAVTNVPANTVEWNTAGTNRRTAADLSGAIECRLCVNIATNALAGMIACGQYSLDSGSTWAYLDGTADGECGAAQPQVSWAATGYACGSYVNIAEAAKTLVLLRAVTDVGDGAIDPTIISLYAECG
jgi:hypothetical protein